MHHFFFFFPHPQNLTIGLSIGIHNDNTTAIHVKTNMEPPKQKLFQTTIEIFKNEVFKYKTHG
jgi:hypothetical protein